MASIAKRARNGRVFYEARVIRKGHDPISKSFPTRTEAKNWAADQETIIRSGGKVTGIEAKTTIPDLMQAYIAAHDLKPRERNDEQEEEDRKKTADQLREEQKEQSRKDKRRYTCLALAHHLESFTVKTLGQKKIKAFIKAMGRLEIPPPANKLKTHKLYDGNRKRTYSLASVRQHFYTLKSVMQWHASENDYSVSEKFQGVKAPAAWATPRDRRLAEGEEERIVAACEGMRKDPMGWKLIIGFALETAMRVGEILGMRWKEINLEKRFIVIPKERAKTRKERQVPLSTKALAILTALKRPGAKSGDRVFSSFPESSLQLGRGFKRITKRAGSVDLRFHDLRHEATSRFFERTPLSMMEVAKITGHTQWSTLERYTKLTAQVMAEKLDMGPQLGPKPADTRVKSKGRTRGKLIS
jgi:integrase